MKRKIMTFCVLALLVSLAIWGIITHFVYWISVVVILIVVFWGSRAIFIALARKLSNDKRQKTLWDPDILHKVEQLKQSYLDMTDVESKANYPDWLLRTFEEYNNQLGLGFFKRLDTWIKEYPLADNLTEQRAIYAKLLESNKLLEKIVFLMKEQLIQNRNYELEAPIALQTLRDHLHEIESPEEKTTFQTEFENLKKLLSEDITNSKLVFLSSKTLLRQMTS